ncbi:MAG: DsbA family protein [Actinobacteria bacterium]|nr:DsbA family protein [Actinomycetota bacterium]
MSERQPVELIVYGDFNCPFSALASVRVSRLERVGAVHVDWRAVEHAPDIPPAGIELAGELASELKRELEQIRGLLSAGEPDWLALPTRQVNTRLATAAFAGTPAPDRPAMRDRLFAAHWSEGADLTDDATLSRLGATTIDTATAAQWREEWTALTDPIVPVMVLPDGYVSRGLGALARLAKLAHDTNSSGAGTPDTSRPPITDRADQGGESPCFAHLLDEQLD